MFKPDKILTEDTIDTFFGRCECGDIAEFGKYRIQNLGVKEDTISGKRQCFYIEKLLDEKEFRDFEKERWKDGGIIYDRNKFNQ